MTFTPSPGIWADSVRKALNPNEERSAREHQMGAEQALLDKADGGTPRVHEMTQASRPVRLRAALARIFRRSP